VEQGILPAAKTAGGHRKLLLADVLEVARRNNLPIRNLARMTARASRARSSNLTALRKDLYQALRSGDGTTARALIHGAYQNAVTLDLLADEVIGPVMHQIGQDWQSGVLDVMHEHRASQVCTSVLYELKQVLESRADRRRPLAVGAAPEGDPSMIGSLLAQMVLLDSGWDAVNLGPNTPLASLSLAVRELRPQLVWLSISHDVDSETFRREYQALFRQTQSMDAALIIGGGALTESLRAALPYTAYGDGLKHLAALSRSLSPRPRRPKRGRPRRRESRR
jgi:methanogenic corrinoid protein MtbC1